MSGFGRGVSKKLKANPGDHYQTLNASDGDIVTLIKAFGIDVPAKIYAKGDIREQKSAISPF